MYGYTLEPGVRPESELNASADPWAGGEARDLPIWTPQQIAAHLNRSGFAWDAKETADGVLTYGFYSGPRTTGIYNNPHEAAETYGYTPMSAAQQAATREALAYWDDLIPLRFQESAQGHGAWDLAFATTTTGPGQAWAYLPHGDAYGNKYQHIQGDVWINPGPVSGVQLNDGFYGMQTLTHEIGHALGLSHPGDYDASDDVELTYALADYYQDSRQYTLMSYWDSYETGARHIDWSLMRYVYSPTPMVHDVAAIQRTYGVDTTTRTGDTTYGFNWSADLADRTAFQLTANELAPVFTIWDAGGTDTLDLSGYKTGSYIDLNPGAFSSAGGSDRFLTLAEINANNAAAGLPARTEYLYEVYNNGVEGVNGGLSWKEIVGATDALMHDNIAIAYGAWIENAVGGSGNDTLVGNAVNNRLTGGAGLDRFVFKAGFGDDVIADFQGGRGAGDVIDLTALDGLSSWRDVQAHLSSNAAGDAVLTFGDDTITLKGVGLRTLAADDFLF
jgi:Ca2+-binding RTX toxin-like protein